MTSVLHNQEHGVLTLTLNRVDKKNALTADMYALLADHLTQAQTADDVRVVLLQGHETVFSAGNDIADFLQQPPANADSPVSRFLRGIVIVFFVVVGLTRRLRIFHNEAEFAR